MKKIVLTSVSILLFLFSCLALPAGLLGKEINSNNQLLNNPSVSLTPEIIYYAAPEGAVAVTGIKTDPSTKTLILGDSAIINAQVLPDNATNMTVYWHTSNPKIVTISEVYDYTYFGTPRIVIDTVGPGQSVITVTTDDGNYQATSVVTVNLVPINSILMNPSEAVMVPGESLVISAVVNPLKGTIPLVTFESTNPAAASVNEIGLVLAKQHGETRIIARSVQDASVTAFTTIEIAVGEKSNKNNQGTDIPEELKSVEDDEETELKSHILLYGLGFLFILILVALTIMIKRLRS